MKQAINERNSDVEPTNKWPAKNRFFSIFRRTFVCLFPSLLLPITLLANGPAERDFTLKVLPLLKSKCFACHGDDPRKIKGDLNMLSREGLLKGGGNLTNVLVPRNAKASAMFVAVTWADKDLEMPPKENDRLTRDQIELVRAWIDAGAPWPSEAEQKKLREAEWAVASNADGLIVKTSGGLADAWTYRRYKPEDIWGFQPVMKPALPDAQAQNLVDHFIAEKLAKAKTQAAPQADPRTLIRRATFDLIGVSNELWAWVLAAFAFGQALFQTPGGMMADKLGGLAVPPWDELHRLPRQCRRSRSADPDLRFTQFKLLSSCPPSP